MPAEMLVSVIHSDALAVASAGPQVLGRAASEYLFKHSTVLVPLAERNLVHLWHQAAGGWGVTRRSRAPPCLLLGAGVVEGLHAKPEPYCSRPKPMFRQSKNKA